MNSESLDAIFDKHNAVIESAIDDFCKKFELLLQNANTAEDSNNQEISEDISSVGGNVLQESFDETAVQNDLVMRHEEQFGENSDVPTRREWKLTCFPYSASEEQIGVSASEKQTYLGLASDSGSEDVEEITENIDAEPIAAYMNKVSEEQDKVLTENECLSSGKQFVESSVTNVQVSSFSSILKVEHISRRNDCVPLDQETQLCKALLSPYCAIYLLLSRFGNPERGIVCQIRCIEKCGVTRLHKIGHLQEEIGTTSKKEATNVLRISEREQKTKDFATTGQANESDWPLCMKRAEENPPTRKRIVCHTSVTRSFCEQCAFSALSKVSRDQRRRNVRLYNVEAPCARIRVGNAPPFPMPGNNATFLIFLEYSKWSGTDPPSQQRLPTHRKAIKSGSHKDVDPNFKKSYYHCSGRPVLRGEKCCGSNKPPNRIPAQQ